MKIVFFENQKQIGEIVLGAEGLIFSEEFPENLKENLEKGGVDYRVYSEGALVSSEMLYPRDGKKFLEALPTVFHNVYLTAKLEQ